MKHYGLLSPLFEETEGGFLVTIYRDVKNVTENVTENRQNKIIAEILSNNEISVDQLAKKIKVNRRTILRDIQHLKKNNKIKRIGPDKRGYWEIIEK